MSDTEQTRVELYLSGKMDEKERDIYEKDLKTNPQFATLHQEVKETYAFIQAAGRIELQDKLNSFEKEYKSTTPTIVKNLWPKRILRLVAVLVLGFGAYFFIIQSNVSDPSKIYTAYYESYPAPNNLRGIPVQDPGEWHLGMEQYKNKNYESAIEFLLKAEGQCPEYLRAYYLGQSYMSIAEPNYSEASSNLKITMNSVNDYKEQATWYYGLIKLQTSELEAAEEIFREISDKDQYKAKEAKEILDKLF